MLGGRTRPTIHNDLDNVQITSANVTEISSGLKGFLIDSRMTPDRWIYKLRTFTERNPECDAAWRPGRADTVRLDEQLPHGAEGGGAEISVRSCDLQVLVYEATEAVSS